MRSETKKGRKVMKKLKYTFSEIQDFCSRPMALDNGAESYLFALLDGRMTVAELNNEIKEFVKEEQESDERNIKIQENRDYAIQENKISDDPEIR